MNKLFIDVPTKAAGNIIYAKLKRLKTTVSITRPANYVYGTIQPECKMILETSWTEEELDAWLYKTKGIDYIGCGYQT
jgi:hypothetical protein